MFENGMVFWENRGQSAQWHSHGRFDDSSPETGGCFVQRKLEVSVSVSLPRVATENRNA